MIGGIVNNNASGMCCGTHANSDVLMTGARLVFADGTILDTRDEASRESFRRTRPDLDAMRALRILTRMYEPLKIRRLFRRK